MFCKYCGHEFKEGENFCPVCGHKAFEEKVEVKEKVSFKQSVKNLFTKFFVFEGRSSRSEFNYGFLFTLIVSMAITTVCLFFSNDFWDFVNKYEAFIEYVLEGNDIVLDNLPTLTFQQGDSMLIGSALSTVVECLLLVSVCYRRIFDYSLSKKKAVTGVVIYGLQALFSLIGTFVDMSSPSLVAVSTIFELLSLAVSIAYLVVFFRCVFRTNNPVLIEEHTEQNDNPNVIDV